MDDAGGARTRTRPTREAAQEAVRTLIEYAGEDAGREGLLDTPDRFVRAWDEFYAGYTLDPDEVLRRTFEETEGYDEIVLLKGIRLESHCEHHLVPIVGVAHVAYLPQHRVVGLSKLARVVEIYSKRMQVQERLTVQIADSIDRVLKPRGVAVVIEAAHECMTTRGIRSPGTMTVTSCMRGLFRDNAITRRELLSFIGMEKA